MNMRFFVIGVVAILSACDARVESVTYSTEDARYMKELAKEMKANGIPFRTEANGALTYGRSDAGKVDALQIYVEQKYRGRAVRYEPIEVTLYFRKLLDERKIEYSTEKRSDGEWTRWFPGSETQQTEIEELVRQFAFNGASGNCNKPNQPSNNALNKDAAQERRAC